MTELFVRDDLGEVWTFDGRRVKMIGDDSEGGGYPCFDWEEAIEILNDGYISGVPSPHAPDPTTPDAFRQKMNTLFDDYENGKVESAGDLLRIIRERLGR